MRSNSFSVIVLVLSAAFTGGSCDSSGNHGIMDIDLIKIGDQQRSHFQTFLSTKSAKTAQFNDQVKESTKIFNRLFSNQTFGVGMLIYQFNTVYKEYKSLPPKYIDEITKNRLDSRLRVIRSNVVSADLSYTNGNWDMYEIAYKDVREQIENFRAELNVLTEKVQEKFSRLASSQEESVFKMIVHSITISLVAASKGSYFDIVRSILQFAIDFFRYCLFSIKFAEAEAELDFLTYHHEEVNNLTETLEQDYHDNFNHKLQEDKAKKASNKSGAACPNKMFTYLAFLICCFLLLI